MSKKVRMLKNLAIASIFVSALAASPASAKQITVLANGQTFAFSPAVVHLKKDEATTVVFKTTSPGAPHGLNVPDLGIHNIVITQAGTTVQMDPKKAGTYTAHCTIVCGAGHEHMAMKFIVR